MGKIYIASKNVATITPYNHLYLVYDPDDDPSNGTESVIRSGSSGFPEIDVINSEFDFGRMIVEDSFRIQDSLDKLAGNSPEQRYYTEIDLNGLRTENVWAVMTAHARDIDAEAYNYILAFTNIPAPPGFIIVDEGTFNSNTFVKTIVMDTLHLSSMAGYLPPDPNGMWPGIAESFKLQPASGYTIDGHVYKLGTAANDTITAPNSSDHLIDGGDGVDTILGGAGNDIIWGGSSGDALGGGDGDDVIHGNDGIDTINGGNGSDTADYSTALGGISVDLDQGEASADGYATSDTLVSVENVRGSNFNDTIVGDGGANIFYGSAAADEIDGFGGNDTADYSGLKKGIIFVALEMDGGIDTVTKHENDVTTEDTLIFITDITGTNQADEFHGAYSDKPNRVYSGLGGADKYSFDLTADIGSVIIVDGDSPGLNTLEFLNYNSSTMRLDFVDYGDEIDIELYEFNVQTNAWVYGDLRITVSAGETFSVDNIKIGSDLGRLSDIATYAGEQTAATYSYSDFDDVLDLPQWQPGTGGTGAGGGVLPTVEGGVITGMQVSPTITTGSGVPYQYAETIMHPWVLTSFSAGGGSATLNYETATKEIIFQRGISLDNVRFNASSSQGNASLTIYLDDLNYSFTMNNFEAGKSITGFTKYDTALHSWVQDSSSSTLNHNGGDSFSGIYANANSPGNWITTYNYLYFLEKLTFTDGSINMLDDLVFEGTSAGETLYGLDTRGDTIYGLAGNDSIYGYGDNDSLIGGTGADTLFGGSGNDTYIVNAGFGQDNIYEGGGSDAIQFGEGIALEDLRFWRTGSNTSDLYIYVGASDRILLGYQLSDQHNGTNNYDEVETIRFADNSTFDLMGSLTFTGTGTNESVYGTKGNDIVMGLGGNDTLHGYEGDDVLIGGAGTDTMYGGAGADMFSFSADSPYASTDSINDFSLIEGDKIDIRQLLSLYNPAIDDITDFVEITTSGSNSILKIDADGGGNSFVQIATLYGITGLTDEEALVANGTLIVTDAVSSGLFASHYTTGSNVSSLSQIDWTATPAHTEVVNSINQTGNSSTPFYTGGPTNYFAVSYEGHLNVVTAGTYTFNLTSDDGSALWIDGVELIDNDGLHSAGTDSASISLTAGLHTLETHYFEATGDQIMKLEWSGADTGNTMQVISGNALQNEGVGINIKPVAGNDIVNTYVEVPANIIVLGNDKDDDGDDYDITSVTQGAHGSVTINQNGTLTYTPTTDYYGLDSFTYTITDINGGTDTGTVDVTVIDDSNSISENFESGASGWSNNTTNDTSTTFTEFLGRFAGATSSQDTSKTFTLSGDQSHITVAFDFYKIDSWDNEAFEVYVDDTLVVSNIFGSGSAGSGSGSFSGGSWERTAVSVGNLGFNAYGADWNDGIYHYELTLAVTDTNVKLGFGSALNESYVENESWGIDNLLIEEEQEFGAPGTYLHKENFEGGVAGWSDTQTDDSAAGALTTFLGRFTGNASGQDTAKTFALSGDQSTITIGFDFYKIDSWDNEAFEVYLNDTLVFTNNFSGSSSGSSSGTFTGGSWERTAVNVGDLGYGAYGTDWNDGIYHYKITLNTTSSTLKVGFGSALDETNVLNESWGVDNLSLGEDLVSGTSGGETLNGVSVGELIYGFDGNDTLNGKGGEDHLYGGAGEDTFVFEAATAFSNIDQIHDFSPANDDKIDLSDVLQGYDPLTDAITDFVQFTTSGVNSILKVDADGGANNFVQIATLNNVTGLTDEAALFTSGNLIAA